MTFSRRQFISSSTAALAGTAFARLGGAAQQPPPPTVTKFEDMRRNVGIFTGRGGTIGWLATPDGALAVDAQFPTPRRRASKGSSRSRRRASTADQHALPRRSHRREPRVSPCGENDRAAGTCAKLHKDFTTKNNTAADQAYADITFGESWSHTLGDEKVWANYYGAGHTGGDAVIFFERANVVHMGDLMFNRLHPRVDRPSGASIKSWITSSSGVEETSRRDVHLRPRQGRACPSPARRRSSCYLRDYFTAVLEHVQKGIKAKQSQDEITKIEALPGFTDHVSNGQVLTLAGTLTAAYEELTKNERPET